MNYLTNRDMKTRTIDDQHADDWFFNNKYGHIGIHTRKQWYIWKTNKAYGETINLMNNDKTDDVKYVAKKRGNGTTDVMPKHRKRNKNDVEQPLERFDIENLHKFDYNVLFDYKQNKKFKKLLSLKFNHKFYNTEQNKIYRRYIEIYKHDLKNGNIDKINAICQRLSQYIYDNDIGVNEFIGGSVICNIALIISRYIQTGICETEVDFISAMSEDEMNEEYNSYCLFLMSQIFTAKYHYYNQYIAGVKTKEWWRICHLRHRYSDKDMKTKGICPRFIFTSYGELNYKLY